MNPELANMLPSAARAEYIALSRMVESDGWTYFVRRLRAERDSAQDRKNHASSWEANRVAHGEVGVYDILTEFADAIETEFASIAINESSEEQ